MTAASGTSPGLALAVLERLDEIEALAGEWRELASIAAHSPFESPDWLLPWYHHYGAGLEPRVLAWRRDGRLVALAPLVAWRSGRAVPLNQLAFWAGTGPSLRGMVDLLAVEDARQEAGEALGRWLAGAGFRWDLLNVLRLPAGSTTPGRLVEWSRRAAWSRLRLTGVVRSETWVLDLPAGDVEWRSLLGAKARHNLRTEARKFARAGGSYEVVTDPAAVAGLPGVLRRLAVERWGDAEINFRPDPAFEPFLDEVFARMAAAGALVANVARDSSGIRACLVTFLLAGRATAVLIGVSTAPDVRRMSLGKHLFDASIGEAITRRCSTYDFLWEGGYKESFWKAVPRTLESFVVGRGPVGRTAVAWVGARRRLFPSVVAPLRGRFAR